MKKTPIKALSESVSAKETLRRSIKEAADYKYALEESCIVAITDQRGIIKYANDNFCKISKYNRGELIGQDHRIINSGYHPKEVIRKLWTTIANGKIWRGELKNKAKDGTFYWVDTTIVPFLNEDGKPYQYVAIRADITERKKLEEQQELIASIVDSSDDAIISKTLDGIITTWNHGAEKIFGYSSREIIGKPISILIPAYLLNEEKEIVKKIMNGKYVDHYETQRIRKDGKIIYVSLTISPIKDSLGNITGASKIARDITDQKETKEKLISSEKQFRHTLDSMMEGIQIVGFDWRYIYVNDALIKHGKYSKEELLGHTMMEKYPGIENTELFKILQSCMKEHTVHHLENEFRFPDGSAEWFELSIQPVEEGIFILSIDITERKKAEQKIIKANRLYAFISAINQSIVHITNEQELLDKACTIAIDIGLFKTAWIGLLDEKGKLNMVSLRGDEVMTKEVLKYSGMDYTSSVLSATTIGKTLSTGKHVVKNDVQNDPAMKPFKDVFVQHGIKSTVSFPLKKFGKIIGVFGFHSTEEGFFDETEITLLEEASVDISFALENFEKEELRKQVQENLRKSETRLEEAQTLGHIGNWEIDLINYTTDIWSDEIYNIFGVPKGEVIPSTKTFLSFIHLDDEDFAKKKVKEAFHTSKEPFFYFRFVRKDGNTRYGYIEWKFEYDKDNKPIRFYGIVQDITERKEAEENLRQSEERLKEAQAIAHTGNWEIDFIRNVQNWSDELYNIYGLKKGEVQPTTELFLSFMHPDDADFAQKQVKETFDTLNPSSFNFRFIRKDGVIRHGHAESRFELDKNKKPIRLYGIVEDVTDRKVAEEELEQQNKALIKTNSELDRFVYSTSHDLRAPLSSLLGLIELVTEDSKPEDSLQKERLRMMKNSVLKLDNFIEDILHYSRNARTEIAKDEIVFEDLIKEVRGTHKFIEGTSGFNLQVEIRQDGKFISDRRRINIVLNNLISNAIKYKDAGKEKSFVKVRIESGSKNAMISVEDNGIGVAEKDKEKIFEMFYRGSKQSTGSGLGLYIVKETIERLEATISIESELLRGSKFTAIIPNSLNDESKKHSPH